MSSSPLVATLAQQPVDPGGPPIGTPTTLTPGAVKVIGFLVAGAALVALADVAPQAALGLASVLALGVLLSRADQLAQLSSAFNTALGHPNG